MTPIAIAPRQSAEREFLGQKAGARRSTRIGDVDEALLHVDEVASGPTFEQAGDLNLQMPEEKKPQGETLEKVVKRIPTIYVIAFFAVVVSCAVLIIWNILQVNKLTLEKGKSLERMAQAEQRLIRLRAQEMHLSAPSRIRNIAKEKLGMTEETGAEVIEVQD